MLFDIAAQTLLRIAADPKHLGAHIGATLVLHTWGSALTHHPHVHGIVPGGGLAPDGRTWVACRPGFFLSVRVLSRLFRRRFLEEWGDGVLMTLEPDMARLQQLPDEPPKLHFVLRLLRQQGIGDAPPEEIPLGLYSRYELEPERVQEALQKVLAASTDLKQIADNFKI